MDQLRDCPKKLEEASVVMKGFYQTVSFAFEENIPTKKQNINQIVCF